MVLGEESCIISKNNIEVNHIMRESTKKISPWKCYGITVLEIYLSTTLGNLNQICF